MSFIYEMKHFWRGSGHTIEVTNRSYLQTNVDAHTRDAEVKAIAEMRSGLEPVFGEQTDVIIKDRDAVNDFDDDGFVDISLNHIYEKYFYDNCSMKNGDTTKCPFYNPPMKGYAYYSVDYFKNAIVDHFAKGGELYFSEWFQDNLKEDRRYEPSTPFPFDRHDVKAAGNYFKEKYSGHKNLTTEQLLSLQDELRTYLRWVGEHGGEDINDNLNFAPAAGFLPFSKTMYGHARLDCKVFSDVGEYILGGIVDKNNKSYFSFYHAEVAYQKSVLTHVILMAKVNEPSQSPGEKPIHRLFVSNDEVIRDGAEDEVDNLWFLAGHTASITNGKYAVTVKGYNDRDLVIPFDYSVEREMFKFRDFAERLNMEIPFDGVGKLEDMYGAILADSYSKNGGLYFGYVAEGREKELVELAMRCIMSAALKTSDKDEKMRLIDAAMGVFDQFGYHAKYEKAPFYLLAGDVDSAWQTLVDDALGTLVSNMWRDVKKGAWKTFAERLAAFAGKTPDDLLFHEDVTKDAQKGPDRLLLIYLIASKFLKRDKFNRPEERDAFKKCKWTAWGSLENMRKKNVPWLDTPFSYFIPLQFSDIPMVKNDTIDLLTGISHETAFRYHVGWSGDWRLVLSSLDPKGEGFTETLFDAVEALTAKGRRDEAANLFKDYRGKIGRNSEDHIFLARIYLALDRPLEAIKEIRSLTRGKIDPELSLYEIEAHLKLEGYGNRTSLLVENYKGKLFDIYTVPSDSLYSKPKKPLDGARLASCLVELARLLYKYDCFYEAKTQLAAAERWDYLMTNYTADLLFEVEDPKPAWSNDNHICMSEGTLKRCDSKELLAAIHQTKDKGLRFSLAKELRDRGPQGLFDLAKTIEYDDELVNFAVETFKNERMLPEDGKFAEEGVVVEGIISAGEYLTSRLIAAYSGKDTGNNGYSKGFIKLIPVILAEICYRHSDKPVSKTIQDWYINALSYDGLRPRDGKVDISIANGVDVLGGDPTFVPALVDLLAYHADKIEGEVTRKIFLNVLKQHPLLVQQILSSLNYHGGVFDSQKAINLSREIL